MAEPGFTAGDVQALVNALPPAGGTVNLQSGATYTFDTAVAIRDRTNVRICGDGSVTIVQTTDNMPSFIVEVSTYVHISSLNLVKGNIILLEASYCKFRDLHITDTDESGILLDGQRNTPGGSSYNTVEGCVIERAKKVGISQNKVTDSSIINNVCRGCFDEGMTVDNSSDRCIVRGNRFEQNRQGVGQIGIDKSCHCIFEANILAGFAEAPTSGITFQSDCGSTDYNIVSNNIFIGNQRYGVELRTRNGSCNSNVITGNRFQGNVMGSIYIVCSQSKSNVVGTNSLGGGAYVDNGSHTICSANGSHDDAEHCHGV
eukprot:TRINITY_DN3409_c0_g1_i1.p1 TRINITY_DN3409_c0_g1~~TRINITY_DN3409_c0_g1_i1.p1  ORF type:complete len:316 (+),score=80.12 TRINITY_DN3409_c0_g1_i1:56-1003(+)